MAQRDERFGTGAGVNLATAASGRAALVDRARQLVERTTAKQLLPFQVEDDEVLTSVASALTRSRDR